MLSCPVPNLPPILLLSPQDPGPSLMCALLSLMFCFLSAVSFSCRAVVQLMGAPCCQHLVLALQVEVGGGSSPRPP
jgi:hypothetical protein